MATESKKLEQMRTLVRAWRTSGTVKQAFCAAQHINIHTFTYWVEKVEKIDGLKNPPNGSTRVKPSGFIALQNAANESTTRLELMFPQGAILRLDGEMSTASLSLLKSLLY